MTKIGATLRLGRAIQRAQDLLDGRHNAHATVRAAGNDPCRGPRQRAPDRLPLHTAGAIVMTRTVGGM
jgi:hypothetical protein